jgi:uncharacterized protein YneF (UPF0154 family)
MPDVDKIVQEHMKELKDLPKINEEAMKSKMMALKELKNIKMPDMKLSDADIDALMHYIAQETQKKRGS